MRESSDSLKQSDHAYTVVDVRVAGDPGKLNEWIEMSEHVTLEETRKNGARVHIDSIDAEVIAAVLRRMINDGLTVIEFHREERRLEDAFIDILGGASPAIAAKLSGEGELPPPPPQAS